MILLLGKNGMLGSALMVCLPAGTVAWDKNDLDITDHDHVLEKITDLKPSVIINATGYTDVDGAESNREAAMAVNARGVENIAKAASKIRASLFHFSTDYVFDGSQPAGYREDDVEHLGPVNVYGESKLAGEKSIKYQVSSIKYFIIRTSWLYGPKGKNFVQTLITRARDGQDEFKIVNDQWGWPTYTVDLAERVVWMVENSNQFGAGIYHLINSKSETLNPKQIPNSKFQIQNAGVTWYDFAVEIFNQAHKLGIIKQIPTVIPCTTAEFPRPAKRPTHSALINTKLPELRPWPEALTDYLRSILTAI